MAFFGGENFGKKSPPTKRASLCINRENRLLKFPYIKRKRKVGKTFGKQRKVTALPLPFFLVVSILRSEVKPWNV